MNTMKKNRLNMVYEKEYQFPSLKEKGLVSTLAQFFDWQWAVNHKPGQLDELEFREYIERDLLEQLKVKYGESTGNCPIQH